MPIGSPGQTCLQNRKKSRLDIGDQVLPVLEVEQVAYLENSESGNASLKKLSEVIEALNALLQKAEDQKKADEVSDLLEELPDARGNRLCKSERDCGGQNCL